MFPSNLNVNGLNHWFPAYFNKCWWILAERVRLHNTTRMINFVKIACYHLQTKNKYFYSLQSISHSHKYNSATIWNTKDTKLPVHYYYTKVNTRVFTKKEVYERQRRKKAAIWEWDFLAGMHCSSCTRFSGDPQRFLQFGARERRIVLSGKGWRHLDILSCVQTKTLSIDRKSRKFGNTVKSVKKEN
jgi:hypothetical protein